MPKVTVQCENCQIIMHTAWINESKDSAKESEVYEKICQSQAGLPVFFREKAVKWEQIHWHAAKLEWEIPPVIRAIITYIQEKLLSKL